ncbi:hypothetical protein ACIOYT_31765 [Streptomyces halstedii]|uniref:hypothetical protein n=1 Tax=Streptomyces halstedii TaxID=1944 RepID=UPI003808DDAA
MAEAQTEREPHETHQELVCALAREHALAATQDPRAEQTQELLVQETVQAGPQHPMATFWASHVAIEGRRPEHRA